MKFNIKKKIFLEMTLDSSEMIMFTKGGKHKITIYEKEILNPDQEFDEYEDMGQEIEISIQMERNAQGRFDFITGQAKEHREIYDNETKHFRCP